jgi:hypothetical protein
VLDLTTTPEEAARGSSSLLVPSFSAVLGSRSVRMRLVCFVGSGPCRLLSPGGRNGVDDGVQVSVGPDCKDRAERKLADLRCTTGPGQRLSCGCGASVAWEGSANRVITRASDRGCWSVQPTFGSLRQGYPAYG